MVPIWSPTSIGGCRKARMTDILLDVDDATRFTEAFTHLRTGEPCRNRMGVLRRGPLPVGAGWDLRLFVDDGTQIDTTTAAGRPRMVVSGHGGSGKQLTR